MGTTGMLYTHYTTGSKIYEQIAIFPITQIHHISSIRRF